MQPQALTQAVFDQYYGGISDPEKQIIRSTYMMEKEYRFNFAQNIDILGDPGQFSLNPATVLENGSVITGLPKWIVSGQPYTTNVFTYDSNGALYQRIAGVWTMLETVSNSKGQGLAVFHDYLYYSGNTFVGRYGPLSNSPAFNDSWQTGLTDTSSTGFAPIMAYAAGIVVGHANAVAYWDEVTFTVQKLLFPAGLQIRTIDHQDEFVAFGCYSGVDVTVSDIGKVYFWDGVSVTFNNFVKADGGVNALLTNKNRLLSFIGSGGDLYTDTAPFKEFQRMPKLTRSDYTEIYPGAVTNFKRIALFGVAASTSSSALIQGVYHWGSRSDALPEGLNLDYVISTGNTTNISIGAIAGVGNNLYIGWKDNNFVSPKYGIDVVTYNGTPYPKGYLETNVIDDKRPFDDKLSLKVKLAHLPLRSGESVQLAYKINRGVYILSTVNSTVGSVITSFPVDSSGRFGEIQAKVILGAGATAPTGLAISIVYDPLTAEESY